MTAPGPQQGCGEKVAVRIDGQAAVATCTDHDDMGHYDPALNLSWPAGDGRLLTEADR